MGVFSVERSRRTSHPGQHSFLSTSFPLQAYDSKTVAKAAFPQGNADVQLRDEIGTVYEDGCFAELYTTEGQPTISPWCRMGQDFSDLVTLIKRVGTSGSQLAKANHFCGDTG